MRELCMTGLRHSTSGLPLTVRVHTNRHRIKRGLPEVWSVLDDTGRLIGHVDHVILRDARFVVQPGGVKRVQAGGRRNVFAWVEGTIDLEPALQLPFLDWSRVTFNPWVNTAFQCDGEDIHRATLVLLRSDLTVLAVD